MKHYYSYLAINYYRVLFLSTEIMYVESIRVSCVISFWSRIFSFHSCPLEWVTCYSVAWVHQRTIPTERPPLVVADRGCHVVSLTYPYGLKLGFLDRSCYFFYQIALQLYSWGWADPVPDPLVLRKSGSAGNWTRTSGSVAKNSVHQNTEAVYFLPHNI
jgi:hypothetical protein